MLRTRIHDRLSEVPADAWNALVPNAHPFLSHEFLGGLEHHGCLRPELGWRPHHLTLWSERELVAAAPAYLKDNSHGEFVFDYSWAEAYERLGLDYYPKLLCAVPYSPVVGPRLLVGDRPELRPALAAGLRQEAERLGLSGVHANFLDQADAEAIGTEWLARGDWQFHWHNRGYRDFADFLGALTAKRRKEIRRERERLLQSGWNFECRTGIELGPEDISYIHRCYARTFLDKGNYPAFTAAFFSHLARSLGERVVVVFASMAEERQAMAFFLRSADTLYGRYWGSEGYAPGLHFECCYYQGIDFCIAHGLEKFEPGAQGEHKLARGFLPIKVQSRHWLRDTRMRDAVARSLEREALWLDRYGTELQQHSPFAARDP